MKADECIRITRERLAEWGDSEGKELTTPLFLIRVGHGEQCGVVHFDVPANLGEREVINMLEKILQALHAPASVVPRDLTHHSNYSG